MYPILLICGAALLVIYTREKIRARSVKALLLKAAESALFMAVAVYGAWHSAKLGSASPLAPFVLLGLLCGLLGDVWLDLKFVFPQEQKPFTLAGFGCFGAGHILFIIGMLTSYWPAGKLLYVLLPFVLAAGMSLGNLAMEKPMKLDYGSLRGTVGVYGFLLFSTVLFSGSLALAAGWQETPLTLIFVGAVLFAASDLVLSGTYFGKGKERPIDFILNYATYYGGQFLIASALYFLAK